MLKEIKDTQKISISRISYLCILSLRKIVSSTHNVVGKNIFLLKNSRVTCTTQAALQSRTLALLRSTRMGVAQLIYKPQLQTITGLTARQEHVNLLKHVNTVKMPFTSHSQSPSVAGFFLQGRVCSRSLESTGSLQFAINSFT